jgi:hypothetical protein
MVRCDESQRSIVVAGAAKVDQSHPDQRGQRSFLSHHRPKIHRGNFTVFRVNRNPKRPITQSKKKARTNLSSDLNGEYKLFITIGL